MRARFERAEAEKERVAVADRGEAEKRSSVLERNILEGTTRKADCDRRCRGFVEYLIGSAHVGRGCGSSWMKARLNCYPV